MLKSKQGKNGRFWTQFWTFLRFGPEFWVHLGPFLGVAWDLIRFFPVQFDPIRVNFRRLKVKVQYLENGHARFGPTKTV